MSYELHLLTMSRAERDAVAADLLRRGHWQRVKEGLQYEHADTGVYATIEGDLSGGSDAGPLVAFLNYVRPTHFALELLPQLADAARRAGILVVDPQDDAVGGTGQPKGAVADDLIRSWATGNEATIRFARQSGADLPVMNPAAARTWWEYMSAKAGLTPQFGATHYVPGLQLVRRPPSRAVLRLLTWANWIPLLLPDADVVAVLASKGTSFEIRGFVASDEVRERLAALVRRVTPVPGLDLDILDPSPSLLLPELVRDLQLQPFVGFDAVALDGFVDEV